MNRPSWIGQTLGERYQIEDVLGQGGMSAVYKATDPNLQRVVAIKMIHPHLSGDPKFLTRFEEEAHAVAQLRHPNIVQVFDFNHDGDVYYMVQEFIPGETLQNRLMRLNKAGRRMPLNSVIKFTRNICSALSYAHQRGMIHRDIKPANIMLDVQGQAILMDFGIVKIMGGQKHTATGAVIGTAMYMSPEMIRGEPPDERSDIYSLGVTLFEMVSGRPPFEADSAMTLMMMHLNDPLPNLHGLRPEVPDDLIAVIEKALGKGRDQRFASTSEMEAALNRIQDRIEGGIPMIATQVDQDLVDAPSSVTPTPSSVPERQSGISLGTQPISSTTPGHTESGQTAVGVQSGGTHTYVEEPISIPAGEGGASANVISGNAAAAQPSMPSSAMKARRFSPVWLIAGGGGLLVICLLAGGLMLSSRLASGAGGLFSLAALPTPTGTATLTQQPTATPSPPPTQTQPPPTETTAPTEDLVAVVLATPTVPYDIPYVRINKISLDSQDRYVVEYETFQYTEQLPGMHVHFFFNTVPPEQAGVPGKGPWILYGGPHPFTGYKASDRPKNAFQICSLVANADHSVQPDSGTCWRLPDVVMLTALSNIVCRAGPDANSASVTAFVTGDRTMVRGLSSDEQWWFVQRPDSPDDSCWVPSSAAAVNGDLGTVPVIQENTPTPTGNAAHEGLFVEITGIHVDSQNRYVVDYVTYNYTEKLPGTHVHFFFDTVSPDQAGVPGKGPWILYGGPRPFTGYRVSDRPINATEMCALVANANHSVQPQSGNCWLLP